MLWLFYFREDRIFVDFVGFLSMIISEVLYTRCLVFRYKNVNLCLFTRGVSRGGSKLALMLLQGILRYLLTYYTLILLLSI